MVLSNTQLILLTQLYCFCFAQGFIKGIQNKGKQNCKNMFYKNFYSHQPVYLNKRLCWWQEAHPNCIRKKGKLQDKKHYINFSSTKKTVRHRKLNIATKFHSHTHTTKKARCNMRRNFRESNIHHYPNTCMLWTH